MGIDELPLRRMLREIAQEGAVGPLVALLRSPDDLVVEQAVIAPTESNTTSTALALTASGICS